MGLEVGLIPPVDRSLTVKEIIVFLTQRGQGLSDRIRMPLSESVDG